MSGTDSGSDNARFEALKNLYKGKDLADCFANLHMTINSEIEKVKLEVKQTNERIDNLDSGMLMVNDQIRGIHEESIPNLEQKIMDEASDRTRLEMWGRKWNLVIGGVPGNLQEDPRATEHKIRMFFERTLKLKKGDSDAIILQATHRLPGGDDVNRKKIMVRFNNVHDRDDILSAGKALKKGSGYSVVPDVPPSVATLRYKLLMRRREMSPEEQKKTFLVYMKEAPFVMLKTKNN